MVWRMTCNNDHQTGVKTQTLKNVACALTPKPLHSPLHRRQPHCYPLKILGMLGESICGPPLKSFLFLAKKTKKKCENTSDKTADTV